MIKIRFDFDFLTLVAAFMIILTGVCICVEFSR